MEDIILADEGVWQRSLNDHALPALPPVSREARERLEMLAVLVRDENQRQNLISSSTLPDFERRHLADSLQLSALLRPGPLVDIGSGAGFPGLALACVSPGPVYLVEPRAKRAAFLEKAVAALGLGESVTVHGCKVEHVRMDPPASITARAVADLSRLFGMADHLGTLATRWVLPKGRSARIELDAVRKSWQGEFRLVDSITDPDAAIVVAEQVRRRGA